MAEVFGVVVSAVQLSDIRFTRSLEIGQFWKDVRNATKTVDELLHDLKLHSDALQLYRDALRKQGFAGPIQPKSLSHIQNRWQRNLISCLRDHGRSSLPHRNQANLSPDSSLCFGKMISFIPRLDLLEQMEIFALLGVLHDVVTSEAVFPHRSRRTETNVSDTSSRQRDQS